MAAASLLIVELPDAYLLAAAMPTGINALVVAHAYGLDLRLLASAIGVEHGRRRGGRRRWPRCSDGARARAAGQPRRPSASTAQVTGAIGPGLVVLLGVTHDDDAAVADRLADKVRALRVFPDGDGRMNEPLGDREVLCVSQFTLYGDARRGNRPSYVAAAPPEVAEPLYERFCERLGAARGVFGAHMEVELVNDGPVTILLESP